MKKLAALTLSLFLCSGIAFADSSKDADAKAGSDARPAKTTTAKTAEKADSAIAAEIEELRQTLQSQQEQLQLLKEELHKRDRQIDEAREAAAAANSRASDAGAKANEAITASAAVSNAAVTANGADFHPPVLTQEKADAKDPKSKPTEDGPASIRFKGVSLTPGGFIAAETVYRSRASSADINTPFTGIPYPGNALSKVSELNLTARQSRATLLFESAIGSAKVSGYYEADFLGAGTTSNNRQSNSYVFRQRQLFANVTFASGLSISGGQMWSLATENKKGIQNRQEALPMQIDPQYIVGFTWQRAYGMRVVQSAFNNRLALGFAIEGPQTTLGGRGFSTYTNVTGGTSQNFFINAPGAGGGLYNAFDGTGYSTNKLPDFVVKAAIDPGWGHYEVFGIISEFRSRVYPCAVVSIQESTTSATLNNTLVGPALSCTANPNATTPSAAGAFNDSRTTGGVGASLKVPMFAKKLDFGLKGVAGDGIGRFGSAQLADVTARPDGTLAPIHTAHALGGLEFHPNAKLDIYAYVGDEYAARAQYKGYSSVSVKTSTAYFPAPPPADPTAPTPPNIAVVTNTFTTSNTGTGGYGARNANNSGCSSEVTPTNQNTPGSGACAGDVRNIIEGSLGFWHKFYNGPKGRVQWGLQYAYFTKSGWSGNAGIAPKAVDNMVWSSFRYYLP